MSYAVLAHIRARVKHSERTVVCLLQLLTIGNCEAGSERFPPLARSKPSLEQAKLD
jgi:hypothetical protein